MATAANSYGTQQGVAALASTWTVAGEWQDETVYTEATNPSLTTVERWIDQVSGMLNTALAGYGFVVPLTTPTSLLAAQSVVEGIVSDLARYANQKGRFASDKFAGSASFVWRAIREDLDIWVKEYAPGIEANGDPRNSTSRNAIGTRGFDQSGDEIFPIFQRDGFGNRFDNWNKSQ